MSAAVQWHDMCDPIQGQSHDAPVLCKHERRSNSKILWRPVRPKCILLAPALALAIHEQQQIELYQALSEQNPHTALSALLNGNVPLQPPAFHTPLVVEFEIRFLRDPGLTSVQTIETFPFRVPPRTGASTPPKILAFLTPVRIA